MTALRRAALLQEIGIGPQWQLRQRGGTDAPEATEIDAQTLDWPSLQQAAAACRRCGLCENRTHSVFGAGPARASWLLVGAGPSRDDDVGGEPFSGAAGQLLDNMLRAIGRQRGEQIYLANLVKCRANDANGDDRAPTAAEIAACMPYLQRQIALLQPRLILALGPTVAQALLPQEPAADWHGQVHRHAGLPLIVTHDPAQLLHHPVLKKQAWADLCLAQEIDAKHA